MRKSVLSLGFVLAAGLGQAAMAADMPGRVTKPGPAPAPSAACMETAGLPTDIFGFATGSDVNDLGSLSGSLQYNGNYGARFGRSYGHQLTAQLSYSPLPCLEIGPTVQGFSGAVGSTTFGSDVRQFGGTVEMKYKILGRATHGVGLTITTEPGIFSRRYDTVFNAGGFPVFADPFGNALRPSGTAVSNLARVLMDFEIVKDKLFGAINLEHAAVWDDPVSQFNGLRVKDYAKFSALNIRAALAAKLTDTFYLGVEGSHQRAYAGTFLNRDLGNAWFAGPTFFWQATEKLSVTGAYNYQFAGQTDTLGLPAGRLSKNQDLFNFNRHLVKVKLAYSF
jgi:predicted chitinase